MDGAGARRCVSDACERNKGPILEVLKRVLPETGLVLEIGAGTGQHAAHFAPSFPALTWQPSDPDPAMRASIAAWVAETAAANLSPPLDLDVTGDAWPVEQEAGSGPGGLGDTPSPPGDFGAATGKQQVRAVFSANMIHIAPWECCEGLMAGAGRILDPAGVLVLYGPFKVPGRPTAPSNQQFDQSLRARDASWGVRDLDDVTAAAARHGLELAETVAMPANNLTVVFRKRG